MVTLSLNQDDDPERSDRRHGQSRRANDEVPPQFLETWRGLVAMAGIVSMAFTGGYNWKEVTSVRADHEAFKKLVEDPILGYMPREVADTRYKEMLRRFDEMNRLLDQIRRDLNRREANQ